MRDGTAIAITTANHSRNQLMCVHMNESLEKAREHESRRENESNIFHCYFATLIFHHRREKWGKFSIVFVLHVDT